MGASSAQPGQEPASVVELWNPAPLTEEGHALLAGIGRMGFTLDLSHMDEMAARQALGEYPDNDCQPCELRRPSTQFPC